MPDRRRPVSRRAKAGPSLQGSGSEKGPPLVAKSAASRRRPPPTEPGAPLVAKFAVRPVTAENREDFEALFSSPGAPKYCWCMVWRRSAAEAKENDPASRKRQMMARIGKGVPVGLLAYDGAVPVAWVSIAPRETYRTLGGPPAGEGEAIWSIACFYVPRRLRRRGVMQSLIAAAVDHARLNGATVVEAYPVAPDAPSYRFMGFVPVFAGAGFVEIGRAGYRRHVMRLALSEQAAL